MVYSLILNILLMLVILVCFVKKYMKYRYRQNVIDRFIEHTNIGYYRYKSGDGVIVTANKGFLKILELDLKPKDVIGKSLSELIIYNEDEDVVCLKLKGAKELWNYEYSFRTLNGKNKWVLHNSCRIRDRYNGGDLIEVLLQDITEEKIAYEKMKGSQERYEKLFKNSGDMVSICSLEGMIVQEMNPVAEDITGFDLGEMFGKPLESFCHPYHRKKFEDVKQDLLFKGSSELESVLVCKDGRYKEVLMTASLVELDEESIVIFIIKDVSNIIRDREEQKKRNKDLEDFCNAAIEREERIKDLTLGVKRLEEDLSALREKYGDKK